MVSDIMLNVVAPRQ